MNQADEIREHLGELATLAARTEAAERRIMIAAEQRLVAQQAAQDSPAVGAERVVLLAVIARARKALDNA